MQRPLDLVEYLLLDQTDWTRKRIEVVANSGEPTTIWLREGIPIHIVYMTAWVSPDGEINFRRDIYGWDAELYDAHYL